MTPSPPKKFEDALSRLEEIVHKLEGGDLTLEDSLKAFEEGIKLSRLCSQKLEAAQKKIEALLRDQQGNLVKEPFDPEGNKEE